VTLAPAFGLAGLAAAAAVASVVQAVRAGGARGGDPVPLAATAAGLASLGLAVLDGGTLLRVRYSLGEGGTGARDVAVVLAHALHATLAAALMSAAPRLSRSPGEPVPPAPAARAGRGAALVGAGLLFLGLVLLAVRARAAGLLLATRGDLVLVGLALGAALVGAAALRRTGAADPALAARHDLGGERAARAAGALAVLATLAAGAEGWWRVGSVATATSQALAAASLLGIGAAVPGGATVLRRALLTAALAAAFAA
jgi:hypothetical protein